MTTVVPCTAPAATSNSRRSLDGALVGVAGDDQLGARVHERAEHVAAAGDGPLAAPPGRADEVVVERDDAQRARGRFREDARGVLELLTAQRRRPGAATAAPS